MYGWDNFWLWELLYWKFFLSKKIKQPIKLMIMVKLMAGLVNNFNIFIKSY